MLHDESQEAVGERSPDPPYNKAFDAFFQNHKSEIFRYAQRLFRSEEEANDAVGTALLIIVSKWNSLAHWDSSGSQGHLRYFKGILKNLHFSYLRNGKRETIGSTDNEVLERAEEHTNVTSDGESDLLRNELSERLWDAINSLPEHLRKSFVLVCIGNMSYREAAHQLGISETRLTRFLHEARLLLRQKLDRYLKN